MHESATLLLGARVHDGIEDLVIDRDRRGEVFRLGTGWGDAGGDGLADIAHLVGRQRRPGRRLGARRLGHDPDRLHPGEIGGGEHAAADVGRHRDPPDPGMRMSATQEHDVLRAGKPNVGDEFAAAAQMAVVLPAQQRRADAAFLTGAVVRHRPALPTLNAEVLPRAIPGTMRGDRGEDNRLACSNFYRRCKYSENTAMTNQYSSGACPSTVAAPSRYQAARA